MNPRSIAITKENDFYKCGGASFMDLLVKGVNFTKSIGEVISFVHTAYPNVTTLVLDKLNIPVIPDAIKVLSMLRSLSIK